MVINITVTDEKGIVIGALHKIALQDDAIGIGIFQKHEDGFQSKNFSLGDITFQSPEPAPEIDPNAPLVVKNVHDFLKLMIGTELLLVRNARGPVNPPELRKLGKITKTEVIFETAKRELSFMPRPKPGQIDATENGFRIMDIKSGAVLAEYQFVKKS